MKKFIVKNYKGNLVESLKRFSVSHEDMKIVNAREANGGLIIEAVEDIEKSDVEIPEFEILDCHATGKTFKSKDKDGREVTLKEFTCAVKSMGKKHDQILIRAKDEDEAKYKLFVMYAPLPQTFKINKAFEAEEPQKIEESVNEILEIPETVGEFVELLKKYSPKKKLNIFITEQGEEHGDLYEKESYRMRVNEMTFSDTMEIVFANGSLLDK